MEAVFPPNWFVVGAAAAPLKIPLAGFVSDFAALFPKRLVGGWLVVAAGFAPKSALVGAGVDPALAVLNIPPPAAVGPLSAG